MELFDTDVLIDLQNKHPPAVAWFNALTVTPAVPGFAAMELLQSARNKQELQSSLVFVSPLAIVWPNEIDCERARQDFAAFHLSHGLGLIDAFIAATAIGLSATLLTFNSKHYSVVPGLLFAKPYKR